ncbi:MAG: glycosyltransferase family 39 protein [Lentisphaeria bacterium]|nr:glycosyltransferase family 39 protein [Lentisphaeria bacterium]
MSRKNSFLLLAAFAALLLFCGLGSRELFSGDETRVAGIIAEMTLEKDWVVPRLNGTPFLEYPPLYYQAGSLCFRLFGFTDAAAKLPSAAAAFCAALLLFFLAGKLKFSPASSLTAGVLLLTGAQFFESSRKCMVDAVLALFVVLAVTAFYAMTQSRDFRKKTFFFLLYAAGLAGGVMTKGLIGLAFPWAGLGIWLVLDDILFEKKFTFFRYALLGLGALPAVIPLGYWGYLLYLREGKGALHTVFVTNGIGRFSGSQGDHVESAWYYFVKFPALFQPYLLVFLAAMVHAVRLMRKKELPREVLLPFCWAAAPFAMLCVSSAKRQVYLLPLYGAWSLMAAWYLAGLAAGAKERFGSRFPALRRRVLPVSVCAAAAVFVLFLFLTPEGTKILPVLGLIFIAALPFAGRARTGLALLALAAGYVCIDTAFLALRSEDESLRPLFLECRRIEEERGRVTLGRVPERTLGAAVFYMKKTLPQSDGKKPPAPGEWRIVRGGSHPGGKEFNDRHFLITSLPVENEKKGKLSP